MISTEVGRHVEVDGLRTFYVKKGSGLPLVMVHGGSPGACALVNMQTMHRPEVVTEEFVRLRYEMSTAKNAEVQEKRHGNADSAAGLPGAEEPDDPRPAHVGSA